ncbi:hypothetical protein, partial [Shewanella sairae]|uniref:hypothetical protein n=1 Tax=Shewanella sairae TaxID=190310 RepID=UPI001C80F521
QYQLPNEKMKLTCFFDVHVFKDHVPQGTMRIRNEKVRFQWIQMNLERNPDFEHRIREYEKKYNKRILTHKHFRHTKTWYNPYGQESAWEFNRKNGYTTF